jgi:thiamine-phosphate pyrophosphorylase
MAASESPQIYLITPPDFRLEDAFPDRLAAVLDAVPVACLRLALASRDEDRLSRAADALRDLAHARDVALVIDRHLTLAARLGLDGVHLPDGARGVRAARKQLGPDAIVGAFCAGSRHDGLTAAETGADYVAFGPVGGSLGDLAAPETFAWWSEMIEVPVVAEGGIDEDLAAELAPVTDFIALGEEIWSAPDPLAALRRLAARL